MKATATTWRLSLLAAVLVHLIALAAWQIVRRRQPAPQWLRSADDTPMLLQFSREEPLAQEAGSIPLPPAAALPPPIGGGSPAPTALPARGSGAGKPGAVARRQATASPTPQTQGQPGTRSGASSTSARSVRPKGSGTPGAPTAAAPLPLALGAGSPARLALEKALHDARSANSEVTPDPGRDERADPRSGGGSAGPEAEARGPGGDQTRTPSGGASLRATTADTRLWTLARTRRPAPESQEGLPAGLAVRELPLSQARSSGADIRHRRLVRFDDGVLLLWVEGSTVWLVRSPLP